MSESAVTTSLGFILERFRREDSHPWTLVITLNRCRVSMVWRRGLERRGPPDNDVLGCRRPLLLPSLLVKLCNSKVELKLEMVNEWFSD
jgi:hypothetical protein